MLTFFRTSFAGALALVLLFTGCDSANVDGEPVPTTLRFEATAPAADALGKTAAADLVIDEVKLLVKSVKFTPLDDDSDDDGLDDGSEADESASDDSSDDASDDSSDDASDDSSDDASDDSSADEDADDLDDEDGEAFKTGLFVVTLDMDAAEATDVEVGAVPPGEYERVTFKLHKPEPNEPLPDEDFRDGVSGPQRYSVIVRGTIDGEAFELKLSETIKQRLGFDPPLVITDDAADVAVTLRTDLAAWFVDRDGTELDPRDARDARAIGRSIKRSFRALSTR